MIVVLEKFKPQQKKRKLSQEKILKQNLKILKALDVKISSKSKGPATKIKDVPPPCRPEVSSSDKIPKKKAKKSKSKKQEPNGSLFTEEDFEKFEKEYFVS